MTKEKIQYQIEEIKNSIKTINDELGEIRDEVKATREIVNKEQITIAEMRNDINWLKQHFWIVVGVAVATLISVLFGIS